MQQKKHADKIAHLKSEAPKVEEQQAGDVEAPTLFADETLLPTYDALFTFSHHRVHASKVPQLEPLPFDEYKYPVEDEDIERVRP